MTPRDGDLLRSPARAPPCAPDDPKLSALGAISQSLARAPDLDSLFCALFSALERELGFAHALVLLADEAGGRLFTIASNGYPEPGVGSEVCIGNGVIGVAAQDRCAVRVESAAEVRWFEHGIVCFDASSALPEIPLPHLPHRQSCAAVPLLWQGELVGVLAVESESAEAFSERDESLLAILANQVAPAVRSMLYSGAPVATAEGAPEKRGLRRFVLYRENETIFVDGEYLIRYVPAQILWRLLQLHVQEGRADFTNRELRIDPAIRLPKLKDNLEARLLLLRKRLEQKCPDLRLQPTGRGRFRLEVGCWVELIEKSTP